MIKDLTFRGIPYKISATERIPQDPSWFSFEDESIVRDRDWVVAPGDVVLDIGAAYGSYALTALASGASFVHTWNPNPDENAVLLESLALNGWSDRAALHEEGLWSKTGFLRDTDLAFSETEPPAGGFQVRTLDSYELGLSRLDWMKLDVEGAEVEVLNGAAGLIAKFRPSVVVENHQFKDATLESRVVAFFSGIGYETVRVTPYHGVSHGLHVPKTLP
jgi:FkbM family methyltransferase